MDDLHTRAVRLAGLLDDAALFPPGNAPMPDAVRAHAEHRRSWYAELVGPFVCSAARVGELAAELDRQDARLDVALTVPGGVAGLADALSSVQQVERACLVGVEVPLGEATPTAVAAAVDGCRTYVEVPAAEIDRSRADELRANGLRLKLRTGGPTPEAVPSPEDLGAALSCAVAADLALKCTAGLHRLARHRDDASGAVQHGFGNVLLAVVAARRGEDPVAELRDTSGGVVDRLRALDAADWDAARATFVSFGTCSIDEPLADLVAAGLVNAP